MATGYATQHVLSILLTGDCTHLMMKFSPNGATSFQPAKRVKFARSVQKRTTTEFVVI